MKFKVVAVGDDWVDLWDGEKYDPDHPGKPAGIMRLSMTGHQFKINQRVELLVRLTTEQEKT